MKDSKIEWTDHTFNPWQGCTRVSPGCRHCYAETMMDKRYGKVKWGPLGKRIRTSADYWKQPLKWNREAAAAGEQRRVFCASLADVFEDKPDQPEMNKWRTELFDLIYETPWLDWLILTKRPENVLRMVPWMFHHPDFFGWPSNVWIGTSVENQEQANKRVPELLRIPATVRFLSCEPLLGPIDLTQINDGELLLDPEGYYYLNVLRGFSYDSYGEHGHTVPRVNWVICGGESGPDARPMHPAWARGIRDQCREAGVPFFFKQWGEWGQYYFADPFGIPALVENGNLLSAGTSCLDFDGARIAKVGKKRAGRLLGGREWNEFPESIVGGKGDE